MALAGVSFQPVLSGLLNARVVSLILSYSRRSSCIKELRIQMTNEEVVAVRTLAKACEAAGITVAQMIAMLGEDLTIANLLYLVERREPPPVFVPNSSRWVL